MERTRPAVLGSGNIGTDLMYKPKRSKLVPKARQTDPNLIIDREKD